MTVWLREVAGWVLLGAGLAAFAVCYFVFLLNRRVVETIILGMMGVIVFRGGMHLLKVAVAARAAREVSRRPTAAKAERPVARMRLGNQNETPGRPRQSVVPGSEQ